MILTTRERHYRKNKLFNSIGLITTVGHLLQLLLKQKSNFFFYSITYDGLLTSHVVESKITRQRSVYFILIQLLKFQKLYGCNRKINQFWNDLRFIPLQKLRFSFEISIRNSISFGIYPHKFSKLQFHGFKYKKEGSTI